MLNLFKGKVKTLKTFTVVLKLLLNSRTLSSVFVYNTARRQHVISTFHFLVIG